MVVINYVSVPECGSISSDDVALCQVSKQITIHELPPVLILHFKRFDLSGPTVTKDNRYIPFPAVLDVAPYCTDKCIEVMHTFNLFMSMYTVCMYPVCIYACMYVCNIFTPQIIPCYFSYVASYPGCTQNILGNSYST